MYAWLLFAVTRYTFSRNYLNDLSGETSFIKDYYNLHKLGQVIFRFFF